MAAAGTGTGNPYSTPWKTLEGNQEPFGISRPNWISSTSSGFSSLAPFVVESLKDMDGNRVSGQVLLTSGGPGEGHAPLLFFFDAKAYLNKIPTPGILDNLVAEGRIAPCTAVFIANPGRKERSTERPCNPKFADFMALELWPGPSGHGP